MKQLNEVKRMQELAGINENSILSDEAYDLIDGLVNQKDMDMLRDGGRNIVLDLIDEGFEDEEIIEYICRYLKNFL
jgi:polyhydroxyalkanoate synthesis regulator phasin